MEAKGEGATSQRSYEEFEPDIKWHAEEGQETLEIHLMGFKKEQLKVQTNSRGNLIVYGERPVDGYKWIRFHKELSLSKDCNANGIRAKFSRGVLSIVMPKKFQPLRSKTAEKENAFEAETEATDKPSHGEAFHLQGQNKKRLTAMKVAVGVVVVVAMVVVLRTYIARLVNVHPHDAAGKDDVAIV